MAGNLRRAAEFVEMNLSQMGKDERRTRIGYKDQVRSCGVGLGGYAFIFDDSHGHATILVCLY